MVYSKGKTSKNPPKSVKNNPQETDPPYDSGPEGSKGGVSLLGMSWSSNGICV